MILRYGDQRIPVDVRRSTAIRDRIRIHVYPDGGVEIEAPTDEASVAIRAAAQKRARWICTQRDQALARRENALPREYVSGETHFYLGARYKLIVEDANEITEQVRLLRGRLVVHTNSRKPAHVRALLRTWYDKRSRDYLTARFNAIVASSKFVKSQPSLKFRLMRTQWGSCSPSGTISLNPALVRAPRNCIDYVVVHELCHLVEHNHSARFFKLLSRHVPDWQKTKAELDNLAELILIDSAL